MHPLFEITSSDIQKLNDEQARELVARLCKAELHSKAIGTSAVTWGGDQTAKDGGVDVRVAVKPSVRLSGYIPCNETVFQVKAEKFSAAKIPKEMAPNNSMRPTILELSQSAGAYVIVSTKDNCSDSSLKSRTSAMAECIRKLSHEGTIELDFYDSRKIADWANIFPGILIWLRGILGKSFQGWRPYGAWAYRELSTDSEYVLGDKTNVFIPNTSKPISTRDAINEIRKSLGAAKTSIRLVGLSGVGKTRLVQALFDTRIESTAKVLEKENVLYSDLSESPDPQPRAMLEALIQANSNCVVVVDNCGHDTHRGLTDLLQVSESGVRLLTIEYDITDDLPEGTLCFRLESNSNEVVEKLLKRTYPKLSAIDMRTVAEFSGGNSRVAFALASTSETTVGGFAQLKEQELFKRLFLQKNSESDELQRCAEVASLLYSFDAEGTSEPSELALLSTIAEVSVSTFYRHVCELEKRGLVQKRGKWRAVLPHAISNRLAILAVDSIQTSLLVNTFVLNAPERVARSFTRRLGYLHESNKAKEIAEGLVNGTGILGDVSKLNQLERDLFENIAPVCQDSALVALARAVENADFTSISNPYRAKFARLLRSLAYEESLFEDACSALLKFVMDEPDGYKFDATRDLLRSLFYLHLSGTLSSPVRRASFVKSLITSGDQNKVRIGLELLCTAFEASNFTSHYDFDFGALKRSFGWQPKDLAESQDWYKQFMQIAVDFGKTQADEASKARAMLGMAFRGLWVDARMEADLIDAARVLAPIDGWPDGWIGMRNTLHWDKGRLDEASLVNLKALAEKCAPQTLQERIQVRVFSRSNTGVELEDESSSAIDAYKKGHVEAELLGKLAAQDVNGLLDLSRLLSNVQTSDKFYSFGLGVGKGSAAPHEILDQLRSLVRHSPVNGFNFQFIRGLLNGWWQVKQIEMDSFLEAALSDEVWAPHFPILQLAIEIDGVGYLRLLESLGMESAPSWAYRQLGYASKTNVLSVQQIAELLSQLSKRPDGGLEAAIEILQMVIDLSVSKDELYKVELREFCAGFVVDLSKELINFSCENEIYAVEKIIDYALGGGDQNSWVGELISQLIQHELEGNAVYPRKLGRFFKPFFNAYPSECLNAVYSESEHDALVRILAIRGDRHGSSAIATVRDEALLAWCTVSPADRCMFVAKTCDLFRKADPTEGADDIVLGTTGVASGILLLANDKGRVLKLLVSRFAPNSWAGSLSLILRQRVQFLVQLNPTGDAELHDLIAIETARLLKIVEHEAKREQEWERSDSAGFE